jgi:hypothetical protein
MTWEVIAMPRLRRHAEFMTTTQAPLKASNAESTLRKVLLANTELSVTTGLAGLIFAGPVAEALGVEQVWLIRMLGAGLLGFAVMVFLIARGPQPMLQRWSREISQADVGWVLGTIAVILLGWLSTSGAIIMAVIASAVLGLSIAQHLFRRDMIGELARSA